jgi:hypothetical protein
MICASCRQSYEGGSGVPCPHCGEMAAKARPRFIKTSTILISKSSGKGVYRDLREIPAPLRSELLKTTNSADSATILIADRRGREEIARARQRTPAASKEASAAPRARKWLGRGAGIVLLLLAVLFAIALFTWRF